MQLEGDPAATDGGRRRAERGVERNEGSQERHRAKPGDPERPHERCGRCAARQPKGERHPNLVGQGEDVSPVAVDRLKCGRAEWSAVNALARPEGTARTSSGIDVAPPTGRSHGAEPVGVPRLDTYLAPSVAELLAQVPPGR